MSASDSWFTDNIGYSRGKDGKDEPFSLRDVYGTFFELTKVAYFHFMISTQDGTYEGFKQVQFSAMERIMRHVNETYADHVEGIKRELVEKQGPNEPIS